MAVELRRNFKWTWKIRGSVFYLLVGLGSASMFCYLLSLRPHSGIFFLLLLPPCFTVNTIINSVHLAGVQSRYRYLLFFVPVVLIVINTIQVGPQLALHLLYLPCRDDRPLHLDLSASLQLRDDGEVRAGRRGRELLQRRAQGR